jgi:hypothetical protein
VKSIYRSYTLCTWHLIWPDSEPTKLLYRPKQKLEGEETSDCQTDEHLPQSTFTGQFLKSRHLGLGVFIDIWSMVCYITEWP